MEDRQFLESLPAHFLSSIDQRVTRCDMTFSHYYDLLHSLSRDFPQVKFQLGPWNPVFCSDSLLEADDAVIDVLKQALLPKLLRRCEIAVARR